jgi:DNA-directed RNA polymerase specialized sigma24 family protein
LVLSPSSYRELLCLARRYARKAVDAEDLLHDALAAAIVAGRPAVFSDRAWLSGVMRNMAAMQRRSATRRQRREEDAAGLLHAWDAPDLRVPLLPPLPPGLRIVLLLALSGHNRAEIRYLLDISDDALRRRLADIRRRWPDGEAAPREFPALTRSALAFGAIRRSLLPLVQRKMAALATHDPDGHAIAIRIPPPAAHKTAGLGNNSS